MSQMIQFLLMKDRKAVIKGGLRIADQSRTPSAQSERCPVRDCVRTGNLGKQAPPCPQALGPQMAVKKLNLNGALRCSDCCFQGAVNRALVHGSLYDTSVSSLNKIILLSPPRHFLSNRTKSPAPIWWSTPPPKTGAVTAPLPHAFIVPKNGSTYSTKWGVVDEPLPSWLTTVGKGQSLRDT